MDEIGTSSKPIYIACTELGGVTFYGDGKSKTEAKCDSLNEALKSIFHSTNNQNVLEQENIEKRLSILNEIRSGLKTDIIEKIDSPHNSIFKVRVLLGDKDFYGLGHSINDAKCDAIFMAMTFYYQSSNWDKNKNLDSNGVCSSNTSKLKKILENKNSSTPLAIFNELYPTAIFSEYFNEENHQAGFTVAVHIENEKFEGTGRFLLYFL